MIRLLCCVTALAVVACDRSSADPPIEEQWRGIEVSVEPIAFESTNIGRLRYRGGIELSSRQRIFGGLSGMEVLEGERLIAISDNGDWFEAQLVLNDAGDLVGARDWRTAMMRDEDGEPFPNKRSGDSEDLAQLTDGRFAVSFEQSQIIRIYDLNRDGPFGPAVSGPRLADTNSLPNNSGLEALTATGDGELIIGAEGGPEATTPIWRAPLDAQSPVAPSARYPISDGYSLTSLDRLSDGSYVALERFFAPVIGPRARIKHFTLDANGAIANLEELAALAPPVPLDNFEGISALRTADGVTRLYIVSDDNFSRRQRTLLLAFDVIETEETEAEAD
jgi:hypothetical protein